jgi:hypothetical protein
MIEAAGFSETSLPVYQITRRHPGNYALYNVWDRYVRPRIFLSVSSERKSIKFRIGGVLVK